MNETTMNAVETVEAVAPVEAVETVEEVKPYTFRKLGAPDVFLMSKIIGKIGINEFKVCFESNGIKDLVEKSIAEAKEKETENGKSDDSNFISVGIGIALEAANVILKRIDLCENEIYQMLSQTSNLSVEEIKAPGNAAMFLEMLIDFVRKEEFKDFIKVVSKLFK
jgi:hypothetical protein